MKKKNKVFMAFSKGKETSDVVIKRYIGVGKFYVLGVCPTKEDLNEMLGSHIEKEQVYVGEQDVDGEKIPSVRITFVVKTEPKDNNGISLTTLVPLFLRKQYRFNKDKTKVQVIDNYGNTAWVTKEDLQNQVIPTTEYGQSLIGKFRPCYRGEEQLTKFIIAYLGIPNSFKVDKNKKRIPKEGDELAECQASLDTPAALFEGNFKELHDILAYQPNNKIKLLLGIRNGDGGRQYQDVFKERPMKYLDNNLEYLKKSVEDNKASYPNTEFEVCDLKEYTVEATDLSKTQGSDSDLPFNDNGSDDNPWLSE